MHSFRQPVGQFARWIELLSEYKYDIIHRPGRLYSNVDPLSRKSTNEGIVSNVKLCDSIAQDQRNNLDILPAIELLENSSEKPSLNDISPYSHETKPVIHHWEQLCIMNQVLYKKWETDNGQDERLLIVIHRELRPFVLQHLHDVLFGSYFLNPKNS